jgi:thioredoxin-related protein
MVGKKIKLSILAFGLLSVGIVLYIYNDITHIYEKNLITDDYLFLTFRNKTVSIKSKIIKDILEDKQNSWDFTMVTYAYPIYITDSKNKISFRIGGDSMVINYESEKYGYIQLISTKPIPKLSEMLKEEVKYKWIY